MEQPQEIYVIDTDVKVNMMNPERRTSKGDLIHQELSVKASSLIF